MNEISRLRRLPALVIATAAMTAVAACSNVVSGATDDDSELTVVAGFYPLEFVARQVGGDHIAVTSLAQPGAEPHDLELKPSQIAKISSADLVLYIEGFQPELDAAVEQSAADSALDIATVTPLESISAHDHEADDAHSDDEHADEHADEHSDDEHADEDADHDHGDLDPHVWLDPTNVATVADAVASRLAELDSANSAAYRNAASTLRTRLDALDAELAAGLETCERREIITSHAAFGYLADRYDLEQIALSGLSPEIEPSPQRLADAVREARAHGATTIFFETLVSPKVAETLAQEVGADTAVLDPIEGLTPDSTGDYFSIMRANLDALRAALSCT